VIGTGQSAVLKAPEDEVAAALVTLLSRKGLRVAQPGEAADRSFLLVHSRKRAGWVSVFDSESNRALALALSKAVDAPMVTCERSGDLDVRFTLAAHGKVVNAHETAGRVRSGRPAVWARTLGDAALTKSLTRSFSKDDAEHAIPAVARALRLEEGLLANTFPELEAAGVAHRRLDFVERAGDEALERGAPQLWWNHSTGAPLDHDVTPATQRKLVRELVALVGAHARSARFDRRESPATEGALLSLQLDAHNLGGPSDEVELELAGPALGKALDVVALSHAGGLCEHARYDGLEGRGRVLALPTVKFGAAPKPGARLSDAKRRRVRHAQNVCLWLDLMPLRRGKAELELWLRPRKHHGRGRLFRLVLDVSPA
jgi:hypothetical protein